MKDLTTSLAGLQQIEDQARRLAREGAQQARQTYHRGFGSGNTAKVRAGWNLRFLVWGTECPDTRRGHGLSYLAGEVERILREEQGLKTAKVTFKRGKLHISSLVSLPV